MGNPFPGQKYIPRARTGTDGTFPLTKNELSARIFVLQFSNGDPGKRSGGITGSGTGSRRPARGLHPRDLSRKQQPWTLERNRYKIQNRFTRGLTLWRNSPTEFLHRQTRFPANGFTRTRVVHSVPSLRDLIPSLPAYPGLTPRAITCRRFAAVVWCLPPRARVESSALSLASRARRYNAAGIYGTSPQNFCAPFVRRLPDQRTAPRSNFYHRQRRGHSAPSGDCAHH